MILIIDGHNFMHRARSGFQMGDFNVVYNTVRNLRAIVEQFQSTRVYFTLEGEPKRQLKLLPEYKANRIIDQTTPAGKDKYKSLEDFRRQKDLIVSMLVSYFPVSVIQHPAFEADELISNLVRRSSSVVEWTIVSTDTDFIQMLQGCHNVRLYNPVMKEHVEAPANYDYVHWKALRGDGSDNIPGIPGMGDKRAAELLTVSGTATSFLANDALVEQWRRNCDLIRFHDWTDEEALKMTSSSPTRDWDAVRALFDGWGFRSLLKEDAWAKLVATFDPLFGPR